MSTAELLQKVCELPAPQQLEVQRFVESLAVQSADGPPNPTRFWVVTSPITGMPVVETDGPPITSEMVREALADFP